MLAFTTHEACEPFQANESRFYESLKAMDDGAFTCLYSRVYGPCTRYATQNSGTSDEAYDHLQATLERFILNIRSGAYQYQPSTKVTTYFIEIFRRSWLKYLSQKGILISVPNVEVADSDDSDNRIDTDVVDQAMAKINPECRQLLELFYASGLPISQIAAQTNRTPESTKNQLYRCRNYLKAQYHQLARLLL